MRAFDAIDRAQEIHGGRIGRDNLHDWGGPYRRVLRFGQPENLRWRASETHLRVEVEAASAFVFSLNHPSRHLLRTTEPLDHEAKGLRIFVFGGSRAQVKDWLLVADHADLARAAAAKAHDILVARNNVIGRLEAASYEESWAVTEDLLALAASLPPDETSKPDVVLPTSFATLQPLLVWAVDDDDLRARLIEDAPESALEALVSAVEPRLEEINAYLDQPEPLDPAAVTLGSLAQASIEARKRLGPD